MAKRATAFELMLPVRESGTPAHRWLYSSLRTEILDGRLRPGARLPGTRDLASQYGLSRGTIVNAFEQLKSEGFVEGSVGSDTYVSKVLPEDDYDGEYRYAGRPIPALQGLDRHGLVLFAGTFNKVLFPSLRLGYLVIPLDLTSYFAATRSVTSRHAPLLDQAVLCDFITEGHFGRHLRRMREVYAERLSVLMESSRQRLAGLLEILNIEAGLQTVGWLCNGVALFIQMQRQMAERQSDHQLLRPGKIELRQHVFGDDVIAAVASEGNAHLAQRLNIAVNGAFVDAAHLRQPRRCHHAFLAA
jgi:DNA-binding transcriptional MocR family regulator